MSLRAKLLLLSLLTLILPWAGWQYARQMENTLREGQEAALLTTATVLSQVVASEPQLLYRVAELRSQFDATQGDLFAPLLPMQPLLDGFADEWTVPSRPVPGFDVHLPRGGLSPLRLGVHGRSMHLYVEVDSRPIRYEVPATEEAPSEAGSDRLVLLMRDEFGRERAWSISAVAPGPLVVRSCEVGAPWRTSGEAVPYVEGVWRETSRGYAIELRAPLNLFGTQLAVHALDAADNPVAPPRPLAWMHTGSQALKLRLEQYAPAGIRVSVLDNGGFLLARAGSIQLVARSSPSGGLSRDEEGFMRSIYRGLFPDSTAPAPAYGLPYGMWGAPVDAARGGRKSAIWFDKAGGEPSIVRAAVPVRSSEQTLGALVVEQAGEQLVVVRELALTRLLNLTLVATFVVILVTLLFAARLSQRIRRLSRAAGSALTSEGRIEPKIPDTHVRDELGALARSYNKLLGRLKEYTLYLQTLGSKLSHELRTPLTIVSSSLENLSCESNLTPAAQQYLERARSGASHMHSILTALSEATRVEQSIEHTERVRFDVAELVRNMGQAYRYTFPEHRIETTVPSEPCWIEGSPELIAQLLDKLMDNATDFTPPGGPISITLMTAAHDYQLSVCNAGPQLPADLQGSLFESLVTSRSSVDGRPHLGLGLYIARLIADFHHTRITAANLPDHGGVEFALRIPR